MGQEVNFTISVKTSLSKERFLKYFSDIEWLENDEANNWSMKNPYAYFSIYDYEYNGNSFFVDGYINTDDFKKLLADLAKTNSGYWVDLFDDDHTLIDHTSKDYWKDED